MRKLLFSCILYTLLATCYSLSVYATDNSAQNWCQLGNRVSTIGGQSSVLKYQQSFPACTITVYNHGTTDKPSLFSDSSEMTPLANPFTAASSGYWQFYVGDGHYDIVLSGGGMPSPFTMSDVFITIAAGTGSVTGSGSSGQCAIWDGSTSITGSSGCTFSSGNLTLSSSLKLSGSSSGLVTVTTAAAAGTWTLTLPPNDGTTGQFLTTDGNGVTTWTTGSGSGGVTSITGTANQVIASGSTGDVTLSLPQSIATSSTPTFAGLMDTGAATVGTTLGVTGNATFSGAVIASAVGPTSGRQHTLPNVTSDTIALLAASQTLTNKTISGSSNTLSNIGNGSLTNSSLTVSPGTGISGGGLVSLGGTITITNAGVISATGTSNQITVSGSTGAVTFSTPQDIATASTPRFSALGLGGTAGGANTLKMYGSSSGSIVVQTAAAAGSWTMTLPTSAGTSGYVLTTDGAGVTTWTAAASAGTVTGTGTSGQCTFWTASSVISSDSGCAYASGVVTLSSKLAVPTVGPNGSQQHILPAVSSDTVALLAATQTFSAKTISGSSNTLTNIGNGSLTNSSVTVSAGGGMSGGGSVSLGGSITLTNAGVTAVFGSLNQITASAGTGSVTLSLPQDIATASTVRFSALGLGGAPGSASTLKFFGTSSGSIVVQPAAAAGTWTMTLPTDDGTANQVLTTDGNGVTSWASSTAGVTSAIGTSNQVIVSGATGAVTFSTPQSIGTSSTPQFSALGVGGAAGSANTVKLYGSTSGATSVIATAIAGSTTFTLPATTGIAAILGNTLGDFASTTSAQLASVLSNETGTGLVVFGTAPTLASSVTIGTASSATGTALFKGTTSGTVTLSVADAAGTWTMKLPTTAGTSNQVLKTDGSGNTSWTTAGAGTITGTIASTQIAYASGTDAIQGTSGFTYASSTLSVPGAQTWTISGLNSAVKVCQDTTTTAYGAITLNGNCGESTMLGFVGGGTGDSTLYAFMPSTGAVQFSFGSTAGKTTYLDGDGLRTKQPVEISTGGVGSPRILVPDTDSGKLFTNEGATALAYFTLSAATGTSTAIYSFCVQDTDGIQIVAGTGDTIRVTSLVTSAAGEIHSIDKGSCITLRSINATEWFASDVVGNDGMGAGGWVVGS